MNINSEMNMEEAFTGLVESQIEKADELLSYLKSYSKKEITQISSMIDSEEGKDLLNLVKLGNRIKRLKKIKQAIASRGINMDTLDRSLLKGPDGKQLDIDKNRSLVVKNLRNLVLVQPPSRSIPIITGA